MSDRDDARVLVIGGGVAGLVVALDLAGAGLRPIVLEAGENCGGVLSSHRVAGLTLDAGAESFATGRPAVGELLTRLGLTDRITEPNPVGAWVRFVGGAAPLPATSLLGIPGHPTAPDVRRVIGLPGVLRCRADALLPARIGARDGTSLGSLVRTRMGSRVLERLVEPVAGGVYATDPAELEVASISPGLPQALLDTGSLAGAARRLRGGGQRAGSAVATVSGGLHTMVASLVEAVESAGGEIRTGQSVDRLVRDGADWRVDGRDGSLTASRAVLALPAPAARDLLATAVPDASTGVLQAPITRVAIVTLVIDDPRLNSAPRGTGVLVAAGVDGVRAKALTHATAKWPWLAELAGPGRHVLRLSYGRGDGADIPTGDELWVAALADAGDLLGVDLRPGSVVDRAVVQWPSALSAARPGHADAVQRLRAELGPAGLFVVGGAVAGSGLASVVTDAHTQAARLFDPSGPGVAGIAP